MTDDTTDDGNGDGLSTRTTDVTHEIREDERPSEAVVRAVASLTNTPVVDLDPLYDVVDPEHLDAVLEDTDGGLEDGSVTLEFNGCRVTVTRDTVHVRDRTGRDG